MFPQTQTNARKSDKEATESYSTVVVMGIPEKTINLETGFETSIWTRALVSRKKSNRVSIT